MRWARSFWVVGEADVCARLLRELESSLVEGGARTITAAVSEGGGLAATLRDHGYEVLEGMVVLEREIPPTTAAPTAISGLGGRMIEPGLWEELKGMEQAKEILEQRIILPLSEPDLASRHGVAPPHAVVLFGPPGTGKTTFAKGAASRLEWPFVPLEPAQLTAQGGAERLGLLFDQLLELPAAVAFVDEVEDLAADREERRKADEEVVTEFLRQVPRLRDRPHHLLVCATNRVGDLDSAFLRPGRFDYILPVGPPDADARAAIWRRYVGEITDESVEVDELVEASERFTPADIEFAARKAAQLSFEREHHGDRDHRAVTDDFIEAIASTRPTLTDDMVEHFEQDVERFARY